jgi:EAL domain-containing protein (putative c-di-GMP-specific phosphodiesterase class I)/GGDEF domain-containing protein
MNVRIAKYMGTAFLGMSRQARFTMMVTLSGLILATAWVVYATGGIRFSFSHFMYVPIVVSGFAFGVTGGSVAALAAGFLLGPYMPINTVTGEMQEPLNWIYRIAFFLFVGTIAGTFSQLVRRHLRELQWLHEHHEDTGLLNLSGLLKQLDEMMQGAPKAGQRLMVSVTQLNTFLEIQNTLGIGFGKQVLDQVIERARSMLPAGSLIALIQPDRIATIVKSESGNQVTRERTEGAVNDSFLVDGVPIHVEASVGVAHFPAHGRTAEELLQKASIAMHWSTLNKSAISVYDAANDRSSRDNLMLLGSLPAALERGELEVWHQAKVALALGTVTGTEALLRWRHPTRGMIPPGTFIPQVEETTLINPVTHTVIAAAFQDAGHWQTAGHRIRVSVNLSVRNLRDRMLLEVLAQHLDKNGLQPENIELEVTESAVMADPENCIRLIAQLRSRGFGVSIDDFGVGHSSLAYLQKLRVSALKIDMAFIRTLDTDESNQKIVRAILHLAKSLDLETVAEGVETMPVASLLREWGCDYGQGYVFHRPAPSQDLMNFFEEFRTGAGAQFNGSRMRAGNN